MRAVIIERAHRTSHLNTEGKLPVIVSVERMGICVQWRKQTEVVMDLNCMDWNLIRMVLRSKACNHVPLWSENCVMFWVVFVLFCCVKKSSLISNAHEDLDEAQTQQRKGEHRSHSFRGFTADVWGDVPQMHLTVHLNSWRQNRCFYQCVRFEGVQGLTLQRNLLWLNF